MRALCLAVLCAVGGCAGIPDADTGIVVRKREPCEVVVTTDTAQRCVSKQTAGEILRQVLQ